VDTDSVSLVIPGRNASATLRQCLEAVTTIQRRPGSRLLEIIFVDDGSTDHSARMARELGTTCLAGPAGGPGAARNVGWRAARSPLIWFIDSDCVAHPDALELLLPHLQDPQVGGAGGSYSNRCPHSLLACLIHEEIVERHRSMTMDVNFLGGFNVLYRRSVLEEVDGFDERHFNGPGSPGAEDAELAYRVHAAGYRLRFEPRSLVGHYHPTSLRRYLRSQRHHGYWRVNLHARHPRRATGDVYSGLVDHCQPPLAIALLASLPLAFWPPLGRIPFALAVLLLTAQFPMTLRLVARSRRIRYLLFAPLSFVRAFARGFGMVHALHRLITSRQPPHAAGVKSS